MSGENIAYHLRQNKAVDRYAFIELLAKLDKLLSISEYKYIGFGGHSLEEFKYIHDRFGLLNMLSIESDLQVFKRQGFNQPYACIQRLNQSSNDFIDNYSREEKTIIWLDYTEPSKLRSQVEEFQKIILKLDTHDVIKITLNAHPSAYKEAEKGANSNDIQRSRIEKLKELLGEEDLFPSADITNLMMIPKKFPYALMMILRHAANLALIGKNGIYFQPLACFSYADGQQMMTVTGIILDKEQREDFLEKTGLETWELSNINWSSPHSINIPNLTIRERLYIDRFLPNSTPDDIHKELGFQFDSKEQNSLKMIETYIMFYRQSPYFSRISV